MSFSNLLSHKFILRYKKRMRVNGIVHTTTFYIGLAFLWEKAAK